MGDPLVINCGLRCKGALFIGKIGPHYVILLSYRVYTVKTFNWIPLFTILLLLYVFEVGKAKRATLSVLMISTLNGLFQKNF